MSGLEVAIRPSDEARIVFDKTHLRVDDEGARMQEKRSQWQYILDYRELLISRYGIEIYERVKKRVMNSLFGSQNIR